MVVHTCRNPWHEAVLKRHRGSETNEAKSASRTVCGITDLPFRRAEIYFELYPAPDADEPWIADEFQPLAPNALPRILLQLRRVEEAQLVTQDSEPAMVSRVNKVAWIASCSLSRTARGLFTMSHVDK